MTILVNPFRFAAPVDGYLNLPGGAGNYLDTPDHADFDVLGDITIDVEAALTDWTPAVINSLLNHSLATGNIRAWLLRLNTNGTLNLIWSTNGTATVSVNSTVAVGFTDGTRNWVRATLDVDDGSSQRVIKFFTAAAGPAPSWTQLGTTVTQAGVTSINNTTALPAIGMQDAGASNPGIGKIYRARLYNGFDGAGTLKASPDFTANTGGSTYTDPEGHVWTLRGTATLVAAA